MNIHSAILNPADIVKLEGTSIRQSSWEADSRSANQISPFFMEP
jgi:hypothetical protein